jgi:CRISPR-associated protein Csd1
MSWMQRLYQTYEEALALDLPAEQQLMPISHTVQNAHINIVIDQDGNFKRAKVLKKTQIMLPATESSAGRSSGEAPHPLADKLQYVAKDYASSGGQKKCIL